MDSLTHLAIGACMGEAFAGKTVGKNAMLWGALGQSIPDIDFIASFWMNTSASLLAHRGFTHSLLFCGLITALFALTAERVHRPHNISLQKWMLFFAVSIFGHIFIDAFNNYGVGWFIPFSSYRVSFNTIYVADPMFSIGPGTACMMLLFFRRNASVRQRWWKIGLASSGFYLLFCIGNKMVIDWQVQTSLHNQQINYTSYFTTPAPLQNLLWYIVAANESGYNIGFRSLLDDGLQIKWHYFPKNQYLLQSVADHEDLQQLIRFSKDFYIVEKNNDTLVFNDLRFGQINGWQNPNGKFVFSYYLQHPQDNRLVIQRGRLKGWNVQMIRSFLRRIAGNY